MTINLNNYEEYFILYMDNELANDDRSLVEDFVQKHPDLKEELDILLQYKAVPDTSIVFGGKEELMMYDNTTALTMDNYEEWLVLYMDNELTSEQKIVVDQFIATNPPVKAEFALLQRTRLHPEQIIFDDKESLYRRTTDRPVIAMRWWKVAVAVLILAIGTTAVVILTKKPSTDNGIATAPKVEQKIIQENPVAKNAGAENNEQPAIANATHPVESVKTKQINSNETAKHEIVINKKQPINLPVVKKEELIIVDNKQQPSNNLPKPLNNPNVSNEASNVIASIDPLKKIVKPNPLSPKPVTTNTIQPSQAVYNPSDKNDELNQTGGKRSKLRGFLRKLTRTFEKTTNIDPADDENRILVGGLAFKVN